jgi:hypothetical protein
MGCVHSKEQTVNQVIKEQAWEHVAALVARAAMKGDKDALWLQSRMGVLAETW